MLKQILMMIVAFVLLSAVSVFAVGPKVTETGRYCVDKNTEADLDGYRFYLSQQADMSGAAMTDFPLSQMSADDKGDTTRTCATRDQTGQPKGQYYAYATASRYKRF